MHSSILNSSSLKTELQNFLAAKYCGVCCLIYVNEDFTWPQTISLDAKKTEKIESERKVVTPEVLSLATTGFLKCSKNCLPCSPYTASGTGKTFCTLLIAAKRLELK